MSIYFGPELVTEGTHGRNPSEEERKRAAIERKRLRDKMKVPKMYYRMVECLHSEADAYLKVRELDNIWQEKKAELLSLSWWSAFTSEGKRCEDSAVDAKDKLETAIRAWLNFVDEARRQEKVVRAYEKAQKAKEAQEAKEALRAWLNFVEARRQEKVVRAYEKAQEAQEAQ